MKPTSAQERMIAALALCPCCRASQERVYASEVSVVEVRFPCGSAARVDAEGVATVSIGCPYPMDDALFEIQRRISGEVRS